MYEDHEFCRTNKLFNSDKILKFEDIINFEH